MQYTVKSGDTLSSIAQKFYGSASHYPTIVAANPIIEDADRIETGWILDIPDVPTSQLPEKPPAIPPRITPTPAPPSPSEGSNKTVLIVLVLAAAALGYMLVKYYTSQKGSSAQEKSSEPEKHEEAVEAT